MQTLTRLAAIRATRERLKHLDETLAQLETRVHREERTESRWRQATINPYREREVCRNGTG